MAKLTKLFNDFFNSEKSGGIILIIGTVVSLIVANSGFQASYLSIWEYDFAGHSVTHWINDGLIAIFFLLIGLELEREVYIGELSSIKNSLLPVSAALGGMVLPAIIHLALNYGTEGADGAGIPMATDIAFALAVLSLVGNRVPATLKVFLTALAVIDDLGAILVIAIFYSSGIVWLNLIIAAAILGVLFLLNRLKVYNLIPYLVLGVAMWYFMLHSGVHATITGVLVAFAIPFGDGGVKSPSYLLQHWLHKPVAFVILPLFALANTSLVISAQWYLALMESNSLGIISGLMLGKPFGIFLFAYLSVKMKITSLSEGLKFRHLFGAGVLGGIGFTMSIFITLLAFSNAELIDQSKMAIMVASIAAGVIGFVFLRATLPNVKQ